MNEETQDIIQGSEEWKNLRAGKVTASRIADVTAKIKSGWGASRANYESQLIAERLTGIVAPSFSNAAMQWGVDHEAEARNRYSSLTGNVVTEVGFVPHPAIGMSGASPDGLVNEVGLVEIKCPETKTHIESLLGGSIPEKYLKQMMWQMACTGRQWCDFCSYDPRLPKHMQIIVTRVDRDDAMIADLESAVREFIAELDEKIARLNRTYREEDGGEF